LVRLTISRAAAEANRIWGGVHASKGGVHLSVPLIKGLRHTSSAGPSAFGLVVKMLHPTYFKYQFLLLGVDLLK